MFFPDSVNYTIEILDVSLLLRHNYSISINLTF